MTQDSGPDPAGFLPLKPDAFLILTVLAERDRHGYGIMQAAESWPGGGVEIQAGALYRRLKWMLNEGLIQESDVPGPDASKADRRRTYCITPFGRSVARAEAVRMREAVAAAGPLLSDGDAG